jgi:alkaline phosphatase
MRNYLVLSAIIMATTPVMAQVKNAGSTDPYYTQAKAELLKKLKVKPNQGKAKNIIIFIGDGMGGSTTTAARIYEGQKLGRDGESYHLFMDDLPHTGLVKTYSHDSQVADSAPTATAIMAGVKTSNGVIGLDSHAKVANCEGSKGTEVKSLIEIAEDKGLSTGVVTTTRITHATPASAYAHTPERDWEDDSGMKAQDKAQGCVDIARQLIEWKHGNGLEVVFGGGRKYFMPITVADPEYADKFGKRTDGQNLIEVWQKRHPEGQYVYDEKGFKALNLKASGPVMGLFEPDHMNYELDRPKDKSGEPSLADMTALAIEKLKANPKGFVLLVEGGRIDHAHHAGQAAKALADTIAFDEAVKKALSLVNSKDTLIIVTSDHSHGLTISGYPLRNNPILGLVKDEKGNLVKGEDGKPYTTLNYATGPGAAMNAPRSDQTGVATDDEDYRQQSLVPAKSGAHSGEDVPVRAIGPWSHLIEGTIEQNLIFHVALYASQLGVTKP